VPELVGSAATNAGWNQFTNLRFNHWPCRQIWQRSDMTLARSGGLSIYVNIVSILWDVVRRTKMLDFPAVSE
jgi:hypothetical protein